MSAIAGALTDERPRERVEAMLRHQAHRGPDSHRTRILHHGALGHGALHTTPESVAEQQPVVDEHSGVALTGDIRLDNRGELCASLGLRNTAALGDGELLLRAYLSWGEKAIPRLLGAFAFGLWDPRRNLLMLGRDHFGIRPLYYATAPSHRDEARCVVFASTVDAVALGSEQPSSPNLDKAIQALVPGFEGADETATALHGVVALPRASMLTWSPGEAPRLSRYWKPTPQPVLRLADDREYDEAFDEAFTRAVARRVRSTTGVASMLSGGLDSSTVTAAALQASSTDGIRTVSAIASVAAPGDDTPHIRSVVEHLGIRHLEVDAQTIAAEHDLDKILSTSDSLAEAGKPMLRAMVRLTKAGGHNVVLSGVGSDEILGLPVAAMVREELAHRRVRSAWTEATTWQGSRSLPTHFARALVAQIAPAAILDLRASLRPRSASFETFVADHRIATPRVEGLRELDQHLTSLTGKEGMEDRRVRQLVLPHLSTAFGRYDRIGGRHGVEVRHPFADKDLVDLVLSLPYGHMRHHGWSKAILRRWAKAELPRSVAYRPKDHNALGHIWLAMIAASTNETAKQRPEQGLAGLLDPLGTGPDDPLTRADVRWTRAQLRRWKSLR